MTEDRVRLTRRRLKTPRAAAIAGILFAVLYGTGLFLIRSSIPADQAADAGWLASKARTVTLALNLIPYSGIAFLWFIGVIRDRLGDLEDRFFSTVFFGSGLLFLACTFVGAALAGGLLTSYVLEDHQTLIQTGVYAYSRAVMYNIINVYAVRMSGVFMISLGTIWIRTGLMNRAWAFMTYALALILLVSIGNFLYVALIFPLWVLTISTFFLIDNLRGQPHTVSIEE